MANAGDKVLIKTKDEELEGTFISRPELLGDDKIVLKLKNGYNVGIDKKNVKEIKVLKEAKPSKVKAKPIKKNPKLPNILVMSTGGTISSKVDYTTGGVIAEYDANDFLNMCPELANIANLDAKKTMEVMSEDMNPKDWVKIAKELDKVIDYYDGIVVTMGTDTLGYAAAAISFMLKPNKPVIFTAAQRSIDRGSSDAFFNLICSVKAATSKIHEVLVCMHGKSSDEYCSLIRGTKVRKLHTSRRDAFRPVNSNEIAKVYGADKIDVLTKEYRHSDKKELNVKFEDKVGILYSYPGIKKDVFENFKGYKGLIIMGTGFGHIPIDCYGAVKSLVDSGVLVCMTSQCLYGRTSSKVYSPLRRLSLELGILYLEDILPETAYIKLGCVLGREKNLDKAKELMLENLSYEINDRIDFGDFLN
ncbi:Glu-tRNA(Gln) amidotransferase subunit GatD [Candidatus Woesearchaeota archaeon]|nr:Glu-tRNA(Gln) amidotransferase subunit GatD [Candidatus Woesearchaeota archaeon]